MSLGSCQNVFFGESRLFFAAATDRVGVEVPVTKRLQLSTSTKLFCGLQNWACASTYLFAFCISLCENQIFHGINHKRFSADGLVQNKWVNFFYLIILFQIIHYILET